MNRPLRADERRSGKLTATLLAAALVVAGCATPPPAPPPAAEPPPVRETEVLGQDKDFAIVVVRRGDDLASLAKRYLGNADKSWWISEFNGIDQVKPGQEVVIPLRPRNIHGVHAGGFQTVPILCYHRFGPNRGAMTVTQQTFEAQMEYPRTTVGWSAGPAREFSKAERAEEDRRSPTTARATYQTPSHPGYNSRDGLPVHRLRGRGRADGADAGDGCLPDRDPAHSKTH
jgi:hypothetical protein